MYTNKMKHLEKLANAIRDNQLDKLKCLFSVIKGGRKLAETKFRYSSSSHKMTLFHLAVSQCRYEIIEYFLQLGVDINQKRGGLSALHYLITSDAHEERLKCIRLLLKNKHIDVNTINCALHCVLRGRQSDIVRLLLVYFNKNVDVNCPITRLTQIDVHGYLGVAATCRDGNESYTNIQYGRFNRSAIVSDTLMTLRQILNHDGMNVNMICDTLMNIGVKTQSHYIDAMVEHGRV